MRAVTRHLFLRQRADGGVAMPTPFKQTPAAGNISSAALHPQMRHALAQMLGGGLRVSHKAESYKAESHSDGWGSDEL